MDELLKLVNPKYVRNFQEFCGLQPREQSGAESGIHPSEKSEVREFATRSQKTNGFLKTEYNNCVKSRIDNDGPACVYRDKSRASHPSLVEQTPYVIKYKSLYYVAKVGSFFGDELFYLIFFPFWIWNVDSLVGRQTVFVWSLVMYFGQATKDYLRWSRPPSPPVFRLETTHLQEYSMPSTHAMAGTAIPVVLFYGICTRYEFPVAVGVVLVFTWSVTVCLSRLYLGVHSVLDVLAGFLYSVAIIIIATPYFKEFDIFQQTHPSAPFVLFIAGLALCTVCYPSKNQHSAKGDAVGTVAVTVGLSYGLWLNHHLGLTSPPEVTHPYAIASLTVKWLALSIIRMFSGAFVLALVREVVTTVSIKALGICLGWKSQTRDTQRFKQRTSSSVISPWGYVLCGLCRTYIRSWEYVGPSSTMKSHNAKEIEDKTITLANVSPIMSSQASIFFKGYFKSIFYVIAAFIQNQLVFNSVNR